MPTAQARRYQARQPSLRITTTLTLCKLAPQPRVVEALHERVVGAAVRHGSEHGGGVGTPAGGLSAGDARTCRCGPAAARHPPSPAWLRHRPAEKRLSAPSAPWCCRPGREAAARATCWRESRGRERRRRPPPCVSHAEQYPALCRRAALPSPDHLLRGAHVGGTQALQHCLAPLLVGKPVPGEVVKALRWVVRSADGAHIPRACCADRRRRSCCSMLLWWHQRRGCKRRRRLGRGRQRWFRHGGQRRRGHLRLLCCLIRLHRSCWRDQWGGPATRRPHTGTLAGRCGGQPSGTSRCKVAPCAVLVGGWQGQRSQRKAKGVWVEVGTKWRGGESRLQVAPCPVGSSELFRRLVGVWVCCRVCYRSHKLLGNCMRSTAAGATRAWRECKVGCAARGAAKPFAALPARHATCSCRVQETVLAISLAVPEETDVTRRRTTARHSHGGLACGDAQLPRDRCFRSTHRMARCPPNGK